ncbi:MAG: hypothetical protein LBU23_10780, partial [Planctomycetota bacterium]|nr:hypothetical protein [Planctomycetota bacterium]
MRKTASKYKSSYSIDLRALEEEVLSEGREWMQRRLEEKLREKRKSFSPGQTPRLLSWFGSDGIGLRAIAGAVQTAGAILERIGRRQSARVGVGA